MRYVITTSAAKRPGGEPSFVQRVLDSCPALSEEGHHVEVHFLGVSAFMGMFASEGGALPAVASECIDAALADRHLHIVAIHEETARAAAAYLDLDLEAAFAQRSMLPKFAITPAVAAS